MMELRKPSMEASQGKGPSLISSWPVLSCLVVNIIIVIALVTTILVNLVIALNLRCLSVTQVSTSGGVPAKASLSPTWFVDIVITVCTPERCLCLRIQIERSPSPPTPRESPSRPRCGSPLEDVFKLKVKVETALHSLNF